MEQLSRKERRKLQREGQLENHYQAPNSSNKKELVVVFGSISLLIAIIIFGFWYINTPPLGEQFDDLGEQHISEGEQHVAYNSNPPTSGPHYGQAGDWGIYDEELVDETAIHNLEHGGIWISYKELNPNEIDQLKSLAKKYPGRVIMSPRARNDDRIALASWRTILLFEELDLVKIDEFIRKNTNKSPERLAR